MIEQLIDLRGYQNQPLTWDGEKLQWGEWRLPMKLGELDVAPGEVAEVRLLVPEDEEAQYLDGALITLSPGTTTPVQRFTGERTYVEEPRVGQCAYVGIDRAGVSFLYEPSTTYSLKTRQREGSLVYGPGWVLCGVNMGEGDCQNIQLCLPKFEQDGTVTELRENEPVTAPMFWGLYYLLTSRRWPR